MQMALLVAIDASGSTDGRHLFWETVKEIVEKYKDAKFYLWGGSISPIEYSKLMSDVILKRSGKFGGTCPQIIVPIIKTNKFKNFVLITDGQINYSDVNITRDLMKDVELNNFRCHVIDSSDLNDSIFASFSAYNETFELYVNNNMAASGNKTFIEEFLEQNEKAEDPIAHFEQGYEKFLETLYGYTLGRESYEIRDKILAMQRRMNCFASSKVTKKEEKDELYDALVAKDCLKAEVLVLKIADVKSQYQLKDNQSKIASLIRLCNSKGKFERSLLDNSRMNAVAPVTEVIPEPTDDVDKFECPILCSESDLVILINQPAECILGDLIDIFAAYGEPISDLRAKDILAQIELNPIDILRFPPVVNAIKKCVSKEVGLDFFLDGSRTNPYDRQQLAVGIFLGRDVSHLRGSFFTIASIMSQGKLVGPKWQWFAVFWKILKGMEIFENQEAVSKQFDNQMKFMMTMDKYKVRLGMSGDPEHPMYLVKPCISAWYVLQSTFLYKDRRDRLKEHFQRANILIDLTELMDFPYEKNLVTLHVSYYKALSWINKQKGESRVLLEKQVATVWQNYWTDGNTLIMLDGPNLGNTNCLDKHLTHMSVDELCWLIGLTKIDKKFADINISGEIETCSVEPVVYYKEPDEGHVPICCLTMRPYYNVRGEIWEYHATKNGAYPLDQQLSADFLYIQYVASTGKFPTDKGDFFKFCEDRQKNKFGGKFKIYATLPSNIESIYARVTESYQNVISAYETKFNVKMTPELFNKLTQASREIQARQTIESGEK